MPTNRVYFADDAVEYLNYGVDKATNEPKVCSSIDCENCKFNPTDSVSHRECTKKFQKWLIEEYEKPQHQEYCFLDMLRSSYKYMGRDPVDGLFISVSAPVWRKEGDKERWGYAGTTLRSFKVKFDFIRPDKYWFIEDLNQKGAKKK